MEEASERHEYHLSIHQRPAKVRFETDGRVTVFGKKEVWGFTPDLKPEYKRGLAFDWQMRFAVQDGKDVASLHDGDVVGPWRTLEDNNSRKHYESFVPVLRAIKAIPSQVLLPEGVRVRVNAELAAAKSR